MEQLCKDIDGLEYISEEKCLVCSYCVTTASKGGVHAPGRFVYDLVHEKVIETMNVVSREFRNLKTHLKGHLNNEEHIINVNRSNQEHISRSKHEIRQYDIGLRLRDYVIPFIKMGHLTGVLRGKYSRQR